MRLAQQLVAGLSPALLFLLQQVIRVSSRHEMREHKISSTDNIEIEADHSLLIVGSRPHFNEAEVNSVKGL